MNTAFHILFKNFSVDSEKASKIASKLIDSGANLSLENKQKMTPVHMAFYLQQADAIKYMLDFNLRR